MISTADARTLIERAYREVLPGRFADPRATVLMLAIGLQESRFRERIQLVGSPPRPTGPARGFWQFERGGGVVGVMSHNASARFARAVCAIESQAFDAASIHTRLGTASGDVMAAAFARLLLWTDPRALPAIGDEQGAWDYYLRLWRPGRPHRSTWTSLYQQAVSVGR